jgi:hypothetical protein
MAALKTTWSDAGSGPCGKARGGTPDMGAVHDLEYTAIKMLQVCGARGGRLGGDGPTIAYMLHAITP